MKTQNQFNAASFIWNINSVKDTEKRITVSTKTF